MSDKTEKGLTLDILSGLQLVLDEVPGTRSDHERRKNSITYLAQRAEELEQLRARVAELEAAQDTPEDK